MKRFDFLCIVAIFCLSANAQTKGGEIVRKSNINKTGDINSSRTRNSSPKRHVVSKDNVQTKEKLYKRIVPLSYKRNYAYNNLVITSIELTEEYTCIHFLLPNTSGETTWYTISKNAFIRDRSNGKQFSLLKADNCAISPERSTIAKNETKNFSLFFQAIPADTEEIDFVEYEGTTWSTWNISKIILK